MAINLELNPKQYWLPEPKPKNEKGHSVQEEKMIIRCRRKEEHI